MDYKPKMDCKTEYKLVIYDTPESAKNATLEQVKIATSSKTISVASAPSPTPRNTGNTEKLKQTSSTCNKSGKHLSAEPVFMGFGEISMPSKSGRKIPHVRTKPKPKGASIESHPKLITDTYTKNDDCRKKGGDKKKVTSLFNLKADT